ncbi:MAG: sigma-70 family RNA polymerase sigma factor [Anaerolineales bacterium]
MDYHALDDSMLFRLVQHADEQAFSVFYDRYVNLVFSIALTIVGNHTTAEEIVQDVFLKIWKKNHTYQPERSKLNTWLSAIARNRSIDELRKKHTRVEARQVPWIEIDQQQDQDEAGPEERVQLKIEQRVVRRALSQLPEDQRQAIWLAYFYGLTQSQIAQQLDLPLGTVKTRIRLGMQKLRALLIDAPQINPK